MARDLQEPSPSPGGSPPEIATEARALRLDGDYRNAFLAYRIAERSPLTAAHRAGIALDAAECLLADGDSSGALHELDAWIDAYPKHDRQLVARILRAQALDAMGSARVAEAITAYREVLFVGPVPGLEAVRARIASLLLAQGQITEAWSELDRALSALQVGGGAAEQLLLLEAICDWAVSRKEFERLSRHSERFLEVAIQVGRLPADLAEIAWQVVSTAVRSGDTARASNMRSRIFETWPETPSAFRAMTEFGLTMVPAWTRARVAIANQKWVVARDALDWILAQSAPDPDIALAQAMRAVVAVALDEPKASDLVDAIANIGSDAWGARALWEGAELRRARGEIAEAIARYVRITRDFPRTSEAPKAFYMLGRLLPEKGDLSGAVEAMNRAADIGSATFKTVRARNILRRPRQTAPKEVSKFIDRAAITDTEWSDWYAWLQTRNLASVDLISAPEAPAVGSLVARLDLLLASGLYDAAEDAAREICQRHRFSPVIVAVIAARVRSGGHPAFAMSLGHRLLRILESFGENAFFALPAVPRKLAFPLAYVRIVAPAAAREGLDPFLLLGLMKQESWFNPNASSSARARGLTQFIQSTAEGVARDLRWPNWSWNDMTKPYVSIPFGARHLTDLLSRFRNNELFAIAAYNAGPSPVLGWAGGDWVRDPDLFVDAIRYPETREYVSSVATYAECFRDIYGSP